MNLTKDIKEVERKGRKRCDLDKKASDSNSDPLIDGIKEVGKSGGKHYNLDEEASNSDTDSALDSSSEDYSVSDISMENTTNQEDDAENMLQVMHNRSHNKWMPIRKTLDPEAQARINAVTRNDTQKRNSSESKSDKNTRGSENAAENCRKEKDDVGNSCVDSSPTNSQKYSKNNHWKRVISSDSSSDDEALSNKST